MNKPIVNPIALAVLACAGAQAAPPLPDAGQITRDLQALPELARPKAIAPLRIEGESVTKDIWESKVRFAVKSVRVTGSQVFPAFELNALVADLAGADRSLSELEAGAARITAYYRERGHVVARAYLPAQDIKEGVVVIAVLEGLIGQQRLSNASRLPDAQVQRYLEGVNGGTAINANEVNRALLLLADTPGVGGVRAALQPGANVGTSDLLVELDPGQAYAANLEVDNHGNRYTGEYRIGAAVALNNPFNLGDRLSLRATTSGQFMSYARLAYQLPLGVSGLKIGAAYSDTRYQLGEEFVALQAHGKATGASLFATYPFVRSPNSNLSGSLMLEEKRLLDQTETVANSNVDKQVQLLTLGFAGNAQDALWGGGLTAFDVALTSGNLSMDLASLAQDSAANSANSKGSFSKLAYRIDRLQRVGDKYNLSLALAGQQASKNLNSSEKFSLGGASGVRAYPQGEASGDNGLLVNLEMLRNLSPQLQVAVFYDAGTVDINHQPFGTTVAANTRFVSGAGLGFNGQVGKLQFRTSIAWRVKGGVPLSDNINRNPRLWLQVSLPI